MEKYKYDRTKQGVFYQKMYNGLDVYLVPIKNKKEFYISIGTKFGSNDISFIPIDKKKMITVPNGCAHFLEHKMFDMASNENVFEYFSKSGSNINACTNYYTTRYYAWGTSNLKNNLEYLVNCIFSPYFTKETIAKEQGIIKEEIEMYKDNIGFTLDEEMRQLLFSKLPIRNSIAGNVEDIMQITDEDLNSCYNTFYQPSNMVLIVTGNFDVNEIYSIITNNKALNSRLSKREITKKKYLEPNEVVSEYKEITSDIIVPKLKYSFKINCDIFDIKNRIILDMYINAIISNLFGSASLFYEEVMNTNLATGYYVNHDYYDNFCTIDFEAESDRADMFKDKVDEYLKHIVITESDFERIKKVWISIEIRLSDNLDIIANDIFNDIILNDEPCFDRINVIKKLKYSELSDIIRKINFSNSSFILLLPKN